MLFIVKQAYLQKSQIAYRREKLNETSFDQLITDAYELSECLPLPSEYEHRHLFLRNLSFRQFIYQADFNYTAIARTQLLFGGQNEGSAIGRSFLKTFGLTCEQYTLLAFILAIAFHEKNRRQIDFDYLVNICNVFGEQQVRRGLNCFSVELDRLPLSLQQKSRIGGGYMELYEQSPFTNFPLIKSGDRYTCVHPKIFYRALENLVFDRLRQKNPDEFMKFFGPRFEKYIEDGFRYSGENFYTESQMKCMLPHGTKCVDFVFASSSGNVFVDCKAVDMPPLGKASSDPDLIADKVKGSAISAIEQAISLNEYLFSVEDPHGSLPKPANENFVLVVSYRELYLGNGKTFYEAIAKRRLDDIFKRYDTQALVPLSNIYFISVKDFEFLVSAIRRHETTLLEFMRKMVLDDSKDVSSVFDTSQHIARLTPRGPAPSYLSEVMESFECRAKELLALAEAELSA